MALDAGGGKDGSKDSAVGGTAWNAHANAATVPEAVESAKEVEEDTEEDSMAPDTGGATEVVGQMDSEAAAGTILEGLVSTERTGEDSVGGVVEALKWTNKTTN